MWQRLRRDAGHGAAPLLMVITDPNVPDLSRRVDAAIAGGANMVRYRDNTPWTNEKTAWLEDFKDRHPDVLLMFPDQDIGDFRADGIHMAGCDVGLSNHRTFSGPPMVIGRSVHPGYVEPDLRCRPGLNYVVFGTVFPSATHPNGPVAGLEGLRAACRDTGAWGIDWAWERISRAGYRTYYFEDRPLPVLAIGGITAENAGDCIRAGAAGVAVIRSVLMAKDPARAAANILEAMREAAAIGHRLKPMAEEREAG